MDEEGQGGFWSSKDDYARGGRLGPERKHTLSDVPNHFIRDFLLEQIDEGVNEAEELDEDQRQAARRALFPDLTAEQVSEYSEALAKKREDDARAFRAKYGIPEKDATPEEIRKCEITHIMLSYGFKHERQAEAVLKQREALQAVDTSVDLTPRARPGSVRNYEKYPPLKRSVVFRGIWGGMFGPEPKLPPSMEIDRDCDQIRLMIRRFCLEEDEEEEEEEEEPVFVDRRFDFEIDDFVKALQITRETLTAFLKKKGPENGDKSKAYELAWEFFKRRELLGHSLIKSERPRFSEISSRDSDDDGDDEVVVGVEVEVDHASNSDRRSSKRRNNEAAPTEDRRKRAKTTTMPRRRSERLKR